MKDNQAKYPQLRFKGFTDPWEQRKLTDISEKVTEKNSDNEFSETLTNSAEYGIISQRDFFDKDISNEKNLNTYYVVRDGDFVYNPRISNFAPVGPIKRNTLGRTGVMSPLYYIFRAHNVDGMYLEKYFSSTKWHRFMELNGDTGARADRFAIKDKDFVQMPIPLPNLEEQSKIARFLENVDNLIAANQRKLDLLKEQKKGYLQKMFPKNGSKFPQLRFAGFADAWEQRKFEYLLDENDGIRRGPFGSALKKECFVSQSDYVVYEQQNAIYNKYETRYNITKDKFEELKKFELKPEDFIMSGAGTIGRISRVPHGIDKGVFNQALIRFRIDNRITDSEYFLQFIRADFMQKKLTSTNPGSAITNLVPMSEVKKWGILVPQINEQSKIGIFFKQLDKTITLHQRKLEKLQELKKGYLQKMFC
ncbi:restriction endonuclease subunit S [Lactiplantibacillus plantarum]|uniref:restriction endonuclease subunit S n=1 Tax=Liquorilactobacillus uvarum TaxID=303240 RepID=UPI00288A35DA|nr:restriction endonuclease subunit S [Liquorilactobacillus uvarum]MCG0612706.1 restriction endonuclease subunit S [Lactiplantibacillus plantarum]MCG0618878.1 restriction endonuclease subunit S [Lactiplantibacillus plantarum]MCG0779547.1 restriction endonuclease subunit S [Lactiplantibacillus plantarum]MCG0807274.1 restriction endonuclease subunit S [Lactiplantibacillus plantarum]MCG0810983.1 restriction endonuclease subunit S [Lactiplantibacillus plantarum]